MPETKRKISEPAYEVKDDPSIKVFEHFPGKDIKDDFLEHLRLTGKPQDWKFHLSTSPPRGARPRILTEFVVSERLRKHVLMAPCPICSPRHPKYWEGMLAWFEEEHAIRAIGRECGHHFLGDFSEAVARYRRDAAADQNFEFMIRNCYKISWAEARIDELHARARLADRTKDLIRTVIPKKAISEINRHMGGTGQLHWFDVVKAPVMDAFGNYRYDKDGEVITQEVPVVKERFEFGGLPALKSLDDRTEARLITAKKLLEGLRADDEDAVLAVATEFQDSLEEVVFRIRRAWDMLGDAHAQLRDLREFLRPSNIETLGTWGRDHRAIRRVRAKYISAGVLLLGEIDRRARNIPIHGCLMEPLPPIIALE